MLVFLKHYELTDYIFKFQQLEINLIIMQEFWKKLFYDKNRRMANAQPEKKKLQSINNHTD